jgi:hypothetical protein
MRIYQFFAEDPRTYPWLVFKVDNSGLVLSGINSVKDRYRHIVCCECHGFSHDQIFDEGFDETLNIRSRKQFVSTGEGFLCVSQAFREFYVESNYSGLDFKHVGRGWHVISVTERLALKAFDDVYEVKGPQCNTCGRPKSVTGVISYLSELGASPKSNCFFSTVSDRFCAGFTDRPLFASEEIVLAMKHKGLKGGEFRRLLTKDEEVALKTSLEAGKVKWPKDLNIFL